jgi:hypothetical protein
MTILILLTIVLLNNTVPLVLGKHNLCARHVAIQIRADIALRLNRGNVWRSVARPALAEAGRRVENQRNVEDSCWASRPCRSF